MFRNLNILGKTLLIGGSLAGAGALYHGCPPNEAQRKEAEELVQTPETTIGAAQTAYDQAYIDACNARDFSGPDEHKPRMTGLMNAIEVAAEVDLPSGEFKRDYSCSWAFPSYGTVATAKTESPYHEYTLSVAQLKDSKEERLRIDNAAREIAEKEAQFDKKCEEEGNTNELKPITVERTKIAEAVGLSDEGSSWKCRGALDHKNYNGNPVTKTVLTKKPQQ